MTREEAFNRIDAIIVKHEIDDVYVTITSFQDYDALRIARKELEQKSEWEQDHEILRAYSNGANDALDHVRAEIDAARFLDKDKKLFKNANASGLEVAMDIIDKYKAEGGEE